MKTQAGFMAYKSSALYQQVIAKELRAGGPLVAKTELHNSRSFIGHIDLEPLCEK
jgi:hypothetical protein